MLRKARLRGTTDVWAGRSGMCWEHAENADVAVAVKEDIVGALGREAADRLTGGSAFGMILRYISYLRAKIMHGKR